MIEKFIDFLVKVDQDFTTPISERVNIESFANKLTDNGIVISTFKENTIIGSVVIYCNNYETYDAYIPFIAVDKNYRGKKISKALMLCAINHAKGMGFKKIGIHTENPIALNLYRNLGFKIIDDKTKRKYLEFII